MMFRTIFTKSLRDYRWAIVGWGMGLGLAIYAQYATYVSTFTPGSTTQIQQLVQQFRFFGEAVRLDTPGGFVTFKIMGLLPLLLGIWTVLVGARMTRGEEEHGLLDILLSTPQSRGTVAGQKLLALAAATGLISLLIGLWIVLGMASAHVAVDPWQALLAALNGGVTAYLFGALALLLAQFMSRAAAAGWTGGLMALLFVLDGTGRAVNGAAGLRPLSPFYYYDQNLPLVPDYGTHWSALALLTAICVALLTVTVPLFARRDVGRTVLADVTVYRRGVAPAGQVVAQATRDVWTHGVAMQALRRQGMAMLWWIVALAIYAGYLVVVAKTSEKQFQQLLGSSTFIKQLYGGTNLGTNSGFLSVLVFSYMQLLLPIFAGMMAYRWAADLDAGRLELVLGTPRPRWRVMLERYSVILVAAVVATLCIWLVIVVIAQSTGFSLDAGRVAAASFGMLPLALLTGSLVYALSERLPSGAILGIMAAFLGLSFLADILKTLLALPGWVVNLSIFHQYGTPILDGLSWGPFAAMLLVAAALLALGVWQFSAGDVERGNVGS